MRRRGADCVSRRHRAARLHSGSVRRLALAVALAALAASCFAEGGASAPPRAYAARAVLVADGATGEVLHARHADRRVAIASITKLMTALVALERARPGDVVTVRPLATTVGESSVHLRPGERVPVRDLVAAALIQSANDAAFALAAHVGRGSVRAFVRLMNAKARNLGLADTRFVRPDGLDVPGHYSTARDVLALARAAMRKPLIRRLVRQRTAEIAGGRSLFTWNDLLGRFRGLVGVKTGHTERAGWCEVAAATRNGATVYAVVLGSPSRRRRNTDLRQLLDWGLRQYARLGVVAGGRTYATAEIPFSDRRLRLVAAAGAEAVVPLWKPVLERVVAPDVVHAVRAGSPVGSVEVVIGGRLVARRPLVAARAVGEPGFGDRVGWYAGRTLDEAGSILNDLLGAIA